LLKEEKGKMDPSPIRILALGLEYDNVTEGFLGKTSRYSRIVGRTLGSVISLPFHTFCWAANLPARILLKIGDCFDSGGSSCISSAPYRRIPPPPRTHIHGKIK
jgi:hypothetical protein